MLLTRGGTAPDPWGRPLGTDFASFWTAARLADQGRPVAAWSPDTHQAEQLARFPPTAGFAGLYYAFFYPPPFLLICLPLGLLPYGAALAVWLITTGLAYIAVLRALLPPGWPAVIIGLGYPAFLVNAEHGQNGALSTALIGAAALSLERRPMLAGLCLGALCYKPQLALLAGPALLAARRWQALLTAATMVAVLCVASFMLLGAAAWRGFLADSALATATLEQGLVGYEKMVSVFAGLRLLGIGRSAAWVAQGAISLAAFGVVLAVAARRPGGAAETATFSVAACLATPFLLDYDLMVLAVPLAWAAQRAAPASFLPWEKSVLAAAFLLGLVARGLASWHAPVAPLVVAALLAVVARRAAMPIDLEKEAG